ncbi:MAG: hypothetical protein R6W94_08460, partial [Spirochaetia bacterium]
MKGRSFRRGGVRVSVQLTVLFLVVMVVFSGCDNLFGGPNGRGSSDGDPAADDGSNGDLTTNEGTVGMIVDVRELARRGYAPHSVSLEFSGAFVDLSGDIEVDQRTSVATFERSRSDFTESELSTLAAGVDVTVRVFDEDGNELESQLFAAPVDSSNRFFAIDTDR